MSVLATEVRASAYADSIVLMQLQADLQRLDGVLAAGVVMGTEVNLDLLRVSELLDAAARDAKAEDLVIAVRAQSGDLAEAALGQVDALMRRRSATDSGEFRPRSLGAALRLAPTAPWVAISIPGRFAHRVALEALHQDRHVFLYSDNVTLEEEGDLKSTAGSRGRMVMGPDCGSAVIGTVGFGFSNSVRSGPIGLVCASGTGLQAISSRIHQSGSGVSQAIGTGGRDLSSAIQGATTRQALDLLARDPATRVVVLASKPPDPAVGAQILAQTLQLDKPVVVYFSGLAPALRRLGNLRFADSLTTAADLAVRLAAKGPRESSTSLDLRAGDRHLRGLFAGGTLALEAAQAAKLVLRPLHSNLGLSDTEALPEPTRSTGHTILDLGADEYTVGRLHPMMDPRLRTERLQQEATDPATGMVLLDLVLGRGAHPDPAEELLPILEEIRAQTRVPVTILVVGTDEDPQNLQTTVERLTDAGAGVFTDISRGLAHAIRHCVPESPALTTPVDPDVLVAPEAVINVGLESFHEDLMDQGLTVVQVDWRPPAGGDERLMAILERMRT